MCEQAVRQTLTLGVMAQWGPRGRASVLQALKILPERVQQVTLLVAGRGAENGHFATLLRVISQLQARGVVVRTVGYFAVFDSYLEVFLAGTPGQRWLLADAVAGVSVPHLVVKDAPPVSLSRFAAFVEETSDLAIDAVELAKLQDFLQRNMDAVLRRWQDVYGWSAPDCAKWLYDGRWSLECERVQQSWLVRTMADLRENWDAYRQFIQVRFVGAEAVTYNLADRVVNWGEAFDDERFFETCGGV